MVYLKNTFVLSQKGGPFGLWNLIYVNLKQEQLAGQKYEQGQETKGSTTLILNTHLHYDKFENFIIHENEHISIT